MKRSPDICLYVLEIHLRVVVVAASIGPFPINRYAIKETTGSGSNYAFRYKRPMERDKRAGKRPL